MKKSLRKKHLLKRSEVPLPSVLKKSEVIGKRLLELPEFSKASKIMLYSSKDSEVDTASIIRSCIQSEKEVYLPRTDIKSRKMEAVLISEFPEDVEIASFGLLEPKKDLNATENLREIDLVIVPGVAFDERGNRLGYGFGFYDRFLTEVRAPKIGLSFESHVLDLVPQESHDVRVDKIVTELRIIECSNFS
jgi:5-formyltetrahydrofolate cyclo-ligase|nr:5-formyltetrahydrofolate cyclo-ligase [Candidatus Undinarchaeales archaeon ERR594346 U_76725]|tara:strand:- start:72930 stop:73502 length:573 start_codon:yes stop_codon:yes gene_type:complete